MKSISLSIGILLLSLFQVKAQDSFSQDSAAIHAVIKQMFDGMHKGDSAMVHASLRDDIRMLTSYVDKEGKAAVQEGSLERFLTAVGTPHETVWTETIDGIRIDIDDNMAHAWVDYTFLLDSKFHHCGVDSFLLVREESGWKIINIADTRRTEGCE